MKGPLFQKTSTISGINVTPIIDVALVLVIILLITTPVMTVSDLLVDLPEAHTRSAEQENRLSITLNTAGEVSLDKEIIPRPELRDTVAQKLAATGSGDVLVVVRADGAVDHQAVSAVLRDAREAGAQRMAIATTRARKETAWTR